MTLPSTWIRALRDTTEPSPTQLDRVETTVEDALRDVRSTRPLLRMLPAIPAATEKRVLKRVFDSRVPPTRWRPVHLLATAGIMMAVTAVALILWEQPQPPPTVPATLQLSFASGNSETIHLGPNVTVVTDGSGQVEGTEAAPLIRWDVGTVDVSVTPETGVDLTVEAAEGRARVHGTAFRVTRDLLGFEVAVREGSVELTCLNSTSALLLAGDAQLCPPLRPAGLLGRAQALRDRGQTAESLAAIAAGLAVTSPGEPVRGELLCLQALVLAEDDRHAEAARAATTYQSEGYTARADEMNRLLMDTETDNRGLTPERSEP